MKTVPQYPWLLATEDGTIYNTLSESIMSSRPDDSGYLRIRTGGKRRKVHTLVCSAYYGFRPKDAVVRHLDNNKHNNRPDNLCWGTVAENLADEVGKVMKPKLSPKKAVEIRQLHHKGLTKTALAARFGVDRRRIVAVIRGQTYANSQC